MANKPDSEYTLGVDVSRWDVEFNDYTGKITALWNPDNVIGKRIDFVIQRISYGVRQDPFLNELYEQCLKVNVRGAYHYFTSGLGWKKQLDTILLAAKDKDYHFFAIDYEKIYNNLDRTAFAEMMELVKQLKLATKKKVILYFNVDVYNTCMKPYGADNVINDYDVWFAQYPYLPFINLNSLPTALPKNIQNCKIWQFGGDTFGTRGYGEGNNWGSPAKSMDINLFYGSVEELRIWAGIDEDTTPEEPDDDSEIPTTSLYEGRVLSTAISGLKIRNKAVDGTQIGLLQPNEYFEADKLEQFAGGKWFHITYPKNGYIAEWWTKYTKKDVVIEPPVDDTESKIAIPGAFKLLSDLDLGIKWEDRFENAKLMSYPATINLNGGKGQVQLSQSYLNQLKRLNTLAQWNRMWTNEHGWHNRPYGEIGRVQQIAFAHSLIWVTGEDNDYYYVDVYYNDELCPDLITYYDKYRINIFSIMGKNDAKDNGGIYYDDTGYIKTLMIANNRNEKLKIEKKYCKSLINLPVDCKVKTNGSDLNIRQIAVDGNIIGKYKNGETVTILEFSKSGNKIWGRTSKGWIALYLTDLDI